MSADDPKRKSDRFSKGRVVAKTFARLGMPEITSYTLKSGPFQCKCARAMEKSR